MLGEFAARDRLIMAGLVVLGLLTVVTGVLSGRSTIVYVLNKDAREAALSKATKLDASLSQQASSPTQSLDSGIQLLDPSRLRQEFTAPQDQSATLPSQQSLDDDSAHVLGGVERLIISWMARDSQRPDDHVSKVKGFALLDANKMPVLLGQGLSLAALNVLLAQPDTAAAFASAIADNTVAITSASEGDGVHRVAFVPVSHDGKVERVYAFVVDQSAAAKMTNTALTAVTLTTSLLIVLGFSVPAAIASRRIRERWMA
jgi:hypothetical protein